MLKKFVLTAGILAGGLTMATTASAIPYQNPANGHWYELTSWGFWGDVEADIVARAAADGEAGKGHLVTINDAAENAWLKSTFASLLHNTRAWIGLHQPGNSGPFEWASGQAVTYTNWSFLQPSSDVFFDDDSATFRGTNTFDFFNLGTGKWSDLVGSQVANIGGIAEYEYDIAVPEPATLGLFGLGLVGLGLATRRRNRMSA